MDKKTWQIYNGLTDEEMENVCRIKDTFNGTIVSVQELPRDTEGRAVAFSERYEKNGRSLLQVWPKRT